MCKHILKIISIIIFLISKIIHFLISTKNPNPLYELNRGKIKEVIIFFSNIEDCISNNFYYITNQSTKQIEERNKK